MTNDTCGHPTADGDPCQNPATEGDNCWIPAHGGGAKNHGRPSKISKDAVDNITRRIAEGRSINAAFRLENLHPDTRFSWLEKIESPEDVPKDPEFEDDPFGYFFRRFVRARGLGEDFYFTTIWDLIEEEGDIQAAMAMMKTRYSDSWGDVDRGQQAGGVVVNTGTDETIEVDPETLEVVDEPSG